MNIVKSVAVNTTQCAAIAVMLWLTLIMMGQMNLIVQISQSKQNRTYRIYKMVNGKIQLLNEYNAWYIDLYNAGDIVTGVRGMAADWSVWQIIIDSNEVNAKIIKDVEAGKHEEAL